MVLKRELNLLDATSIGIGAIIGAGIFVVLGVAIGYAGPAVILSMVIAGIVATFTALSFAELSSAMPKEGGIYAFSYELISPSAAFVVGSLWLFGQIFAGAAVSLGFAHYFLVLVPSFPLKIVAIFAALAFTLLNLIGIKGSAEFNNLLVLLKIAILGVFIFAGIPHMDGNNFIPFSPNGLFGIIQGAGVIFFAYLGLGRVAALGEEVKNPEKTLPLSIFLALAISVLIYLLTGIVAIGLEGYDVLSGSGSPIAQAAAVTGSQLFVVLVSLGALMATSSVLLTNLIGLSRFSFAMARNRQLPQPLVKLHPAFGTPYISILVTGALTVLLVFFLDLRLTAVITSFAILVTYFVLNYAAIMLRKKNPDLKTFRSPMHPAVPVLGMLSCLLLMVSLPPESWLAAAVVVAASICYYRLVLKKTGNK